MINKIIDTNDWANKHWVTYYRRWVATDNVQRIYNFRDGKKSEIQIDMFECKSTNPKSELSVANKNMESILKSVNVGLKSIGYFAKSSVQISKNKLTYIIFLFDYKDPKYYMLFDQKERNELIFQV